MKPFKFIGTILWSLILLVTLPATIVRGDNCDICGQPMHGGFYLVTDKLTGKEVEVCSNCEFHLPRCYLCGLPIKAGDEIKLPDGRYLCARDGATAVLDAGQAQQVCSTVKDDLDHLFSRFTSFPDNVDVNVIDRIDVDSMFNASGHDFESPDLLGCIQPVADNGVKRYHMSLMIGLPLSELKETCAHEYSHAWVGENVRPDRHWRIDRDAEEGFCEMMGYLLMDSQGEEGEKQRILKNRYTRGQVELFIAAEQQYGFDDVLDWMRYGVTSRLVDGQLAEIKDVKMPTSATTSLTATEIPQAIAPVKTPTVVTTVLKLVDGQLVEINDVEMPTSSTTRLTATKIPQAIASVKTPTVVTTVLKLEGILWGNPASAIINGHSFFLNDVNYVKLGGTNVAIRCDAIQPTKVRVTNLTSGQGLDLILPGN